MTLHFNSGKEVERGTQCSTGRDACQTFVGLETTDMKRLVVKLRQRGTNKGIYFK